MSAHLTSPLHQIHFHDAECGAYRGDLALWERLAAERGDPVLDLGCGTGRVTLHLAALGHRVVAVDSEATLIGALADRAERVGLAERVDAVTADVRDLGLGGRRVPLAIAPMQLAQLLDSRGRAAMLERVAAALTPRGVLCAVLLDDGPELAGGRAELLPDISEAGGWVHSSLPLEVRTLPDAIEIVRLRQLVDPGGSLEEERQVVRLERLDPRRLEDEAVVAGLRPAGREAIAPTPEHVGSTAVLLEAAGG